MTTSKEFSYQDIVYYASEADPATIYYIPAAPVPQRNADGMPAISLFVLDQMAMLQLSSQWEVPTSQLEALNTAVLQQFPALKPELLRLLPALVEVERVELALTNAAGKPECLETTKSSGQPPFSAIFSVQLSNEQKAQTVSAFNGRKDLLTVTYYAVQSKQAIAAVTISGNVAPLLKRLPKDPSVQACLQQLEAAIAHNQLSVERSQSSQAPESLRQKAEQLAKERAVELLQSLTQGCTTQDRSQFRATATVTEDIPTALRRSADVSSWFPNGKGLDYLQIIGV